MSKADDRKLRGAALEYFNTKEWSDPYAVTLTLKKTMRGREFWVQRREGDAQSNLRHFLNVLTKRLRRYGFSKSESLQCAPVLEGDDYTRPHFHLVIDKPHCVTREQFEALIYHEWPRTHWGHRRLTIEPCYDTAGCLSYFLKLRTKSDYGAAIDWTNVR